MRVVLFVLVARSLQYVTPPLVRIDLYQMSSSHMLSLTGSVASDPWEVLHSAVLLAR